MKEFFEKISNFFKNILKKALNASKMAKIITIASVVVIITTVILLLVLIPANSVKSIVLDKSTLDLTYGGSSETLIATVEAKDKTVTWTSSNENVVRVEKGVVTPVNAGEATVTVKSSVDEEKYAQCLVTVLKASNSITSFAMEGWTYGDAPNKPTASAVYGTPSFSYSTQKDGPYTSTKPTDAGSYYVQVVVEEGENYNSITKSLQFTISKANYDMKDVKWDYTNAFTYSGEAKTVEVQNLPSGVTVKEYTNNSKTDAGDYISTVTFDYDTTNYNEPTIADCSWKINKKDATITTTDVLKEYTYTGSEQVVNSGATVDSGATLTYTNNTFTNVPSSGKQTITISACETENYNATSTTIEINISKADPAAPKKASITSSSVTLTAVSEGQGVMYGYNTTNTAPDSWQESAEFTGLSENTTYYFFVKYEGNDNYYDGVSATGAVIKTDYPWKPLSATVQGSTVYYFPVLGGSNPQPEKFAYSEDGVTFTEIEKTADKYTMDDVKEYAKKGQLYYYGGSLYTLRTIGYMSYDNTFGSESTGENGIKNMIDECETVEKLCDDSITLTLGTSDNPPTFNGVSLKDIHTAYEGGTVLFGTGDKYDSFWSNKEVDKQVNCFCYFINECKWYSTDKTAELCVVISRTFNYN